jgi:hypothetical protein
VGTICRLSLSTNGVGTTTNPFFLSSNSNILSYDFGTNSLYNSYVANDTIWHLVVTWAC